MFVPIAFVADNQFDVIALWLFIAKALANAMKMQDTIATSSLKSLQHPPTINHPLEILILKIGIPYATSGLGES